MNTAFDFSLYLAVLGTRLSWPICKYYAGINLIQKVRNHRDGGVLCGGSGACQLRKKVDSYFEPAVQTARECSTILVENESILNTDFRYGIASRRPDLKHGFQDSVFRSCAEFFGTVLEPSHRKGSRLRSWMDKRNGDS
jgi:hypothetical protein